MWDNWSPFPVLVPFYMPSSWRFFFSPGMFQSSRSYATFLLVSEELVSFIKHLLQKASWTPPWKKLLGQRLGEHRSRSCLFSEAITGRFVPFKPDPDSTFTSRDGWFCRFWFFQFLIFHVFNSVLRISATIRGLFIYLNAQENFPSF